MPNLAWDQTWDQTKKVPDQMQNKTCLNWLGLELQHSTERSMHASCLTNMAYRHYGDVLANKHYLPSPITAIQVLHFLLFKVFPCLSIPFARLASNTAIFPSCLCNTVCLVSLCSAMATFMACLCKAMAEPILWHPFPATSGMRVPCRTSLLQNASMLPCLGVKLNFMSRNSNTAPVGGVPEPARTKRFKDWGCSKLVAQNLLN